MDCQTRRVRRAGDDAPSGPCMEWPLLVLEPAYWSDSGSAWSLPSRSTHAKVECPSASSTASR
jgi:hypothetical protein